MLQKFLRNHTLILCFVLIVILGTLSGGEITYGINKRGNDAEGGELEEAEQRLVRVEAEDPDLVGSVLDIDLDGANKFRKKKTALPVISSEESQSFFFSALMIIVSEIGDKTFFIAAIMAMKNPRLIVFLAAFSALALMSVLSAALGYAVPNMIPKFYTNYLAALLFLFFGIKMGFEGWQMTEDEGKHELEEVSAELKEKEETGRIETAEAGGVSSEPSQATFMEGLINLCQFIFSPVFVQTFVLSFLAEWGDRSQIATIALAASQDVYWVIAGTITGHSICTGLAVIGGRLLASKISVKRITITGAILFISFAFLYLFEGVYEESHS